VSEIVAEVILRGRDGRSILDTPTPPMDPDDLERVRPTPGAFSAARAALAARGFKVLDDGATGFGIAGTRALFEEVFSTELSLRTANGEPSWQPERPVEIPEDLSEWVAAVAFSTPPEFFF
jgi:hypothetical protein